MKIIFLYLLLLSNLVYSQISIDVKNWYIFESKYQDYYSIISDSNKVITRYAWGDNTLKFDLQKNTYSFLFLSNEYAKGKMTWSQGKDSTHIFVCQTIDLKTGLPMDLIVTLKLNAKFGEIIVTEFYWDELTNKSYGMISYKN
jgi:hypothetical protein